MATIEQTVRKTVDLFDKCRRFTAAREMIDNGVRAVWLPSSLPPGGKCLVSAGPAGNPGTYIRIDPFGTAEAPSGLMAAFYWGPHVAVPLRNRSLRAPRGPQSANPRLQP